MREHVTSATVRDRSGVVGLRVRRSSRKDGASPEEEEEGKKRMILPELRGERWRVSPFVRKCDAFLRRLRFSLHGVFSLM